MSLAGSGSRLIRNDGPGDVWRPERDTGSRVERIIKSDLGNGDNDGEHWRITSTDGTQYFFGSRPESKSTWTVPVFGDDTNEPCHSDSGFDGSSCAQGYRWNLDKIIDPRGNVVLYQYQTEKNLYGRNKSKSGAEYVRDGWLSQIDYGLTEGSSAPASAQVVFTEADRCVPGSECTFDKPKNLPDVPLELKCDSGTCPDKWSPTFWSSKRLSKVTTKVRSGDGYADVDSWTLRHEFPDPGDGEKAALWLAGVTHTGLAGTPITQPEVTFEGIRKPNRVTHGDSYATLNRYRINAIVSETGGVTSIKYADTTCRVETLPDHPENNNQRCFPAWWAASGSPERTDYFHKYVVEEVTSLDRIGSSVGDITRYQYLDTPAWHYDKSELTKEDKKTWNEYRGFGHVRVTKGLPDDGAPQVTEHRYYRGMHGDKLRNGTRTVSFRDSENSGLERFDEDWLAGMTYETVTYNGSSVVSKTINEPGWSEPTAVRGPYQARRVFTKAVDTYVPLAAGGQRHTRKETEYDDALMPTNVNDLGDVNTATDDLCSRTTYARNVEKWMLSYPSKTETVSVKCDGKAVIPSDAVAGLRHSYDGQDAGAAPRAGNVTRVEEWANRGDFGVEYVTVSKSTHDIYGRVIEAVDPQGHVSRTKFIPDTGPVTKLESTNPLGHKTTLDMDVRFGQATKVVDAAGNVTETTYDALGRVTEVWLGNRMRSKNPGSYQFAYHVSRDKPSAVTTKSINASGRYTTTSMIYDGLLRVRQVQAPSPGGGRLLTDTRYDSAGRAYKSTQPYYNSADVDTNLWSATDADIPALTLTQFDGAGRTEKQTFKGINREWTTTTQYGGDRVTVTPPPGGIPTTTITDARGRTVELRQHKTATEYDATRYEHDPAGQLTKVTDPAGNVWTYTYDLRGRKIREEDPDTGIKTTVYDISNRVTSTTDARNTTLAYAYDALGRKTALHQDSLTGPKLAEWTYDTASWGVGLPASATRWINNEAYTQKVTLYDGLKQPMTTVTSIPASQKGIAGSYTTKASYAPDGSPMSTTMPKIGKLELEQVTYSADEQGRPYRSYGALTGTGTIEYATQTLYTKYGEPERVQLGEEPRRVWQSLFYEDDTRRGMRATTDAETARPIVSDVNYTRDVIGNIISITDRADLTVDAVPDKQCFAYDHLLRLTDAWTPKGDCSTPRPEAVLGGPAPYSQAFSYDKIGNRLTETRRDLGGETERIYTYPPSGRKLQAVDSRGPSGAQRDEFGYDPTGNTTRRKLFNSEQILDWDLEGQLTKVTEADKKTEFVYDANGGRLIRHDPTSVTLYLAGQELRVDKATGVQQATRYYTHGGSVIAMRTDAGLAWLTGDHQGTAQIAIDATTLKVTRRRQTPFGGSRGAPDLFPGEKGFVGGTIDASIGLVTLGARQYDSEIGRFLSVDPIMNTTDPQQMQGYSYSNNNPVTFSDPSGLYCDGCSGLYDHEVGVNCPGPACTWSYDEPDHYCDSCNGGQGSPTSKGGYPSKVGQTGKPALDMSKMSRRPILRELKRHFYEYNGEWYALDGQEGVLDPIPGYIPPEEISTSTRVLVGAALVAGVACMLTVGCGVAAFGLAAEAAGPDAALALQGAGHGTRIAVGLGAGAAVIKGSHGFGDTIKNVLNSVKRGCSFVPGTLVLMADGTYKPIEELQVGDMVLATDPETGETGPRAVLAPLSSEGIKTLIHITIDTDSDAGDQTGTLIATDNHPFWAPDLREWITAAELRVGSLLQTAAGTSVQVTAVRSWSAQQRVHNLTVADVHTYYVLVGNSGVLVHNSGGSCPRLWMDENKLNHHYSHAADFGVLGPPNKVNGERFVNAIQDFTKNSETISFRGTFRGQEAIHYVNPRTGLHASFALEGPKVGSYLGGWKSAPDTDQYAYLMRDGVL